MYKSILYKQEAREKLFEGVRKLSEAVITTLGTRGNNVAIEMQYGVPRVIHDGVSVAKEVFLKDKFENLGATLVKEASLKTAREAGDGTTTSTLLAYKLVEKGLELIKSGHSAMIMKKGIETATENICASIEKLSVPVKDEDYEKIAILSSQSKEIGEAVAKAVRMVNGKGIVEVERTNILGISVEHKEGMELDRGLINPYLVTDPDKMLSRLENPYILVTDYKLNALTEILPSVEAIRKEHGSILVIAENFSDEFIKDAISNKLKGLLNIALIRAPLFGEKRVKVLEDIAIATGAKFISKEAGFLIEDIVMEDYGRSGSVISDQYKTRIIDGSGDKKAIEKRIKLIDSLIETTENDFDLEQLEERKAKLASGVALIKVGAISEIETDNLYERAVDAKEALISALEMGIVVGGGLTFVNALKDFKTVPDPRESYGAGYHLVLDLMYEPIKKLFDNSAMDFKEFKNEGREINFGLDVNDNTYKNLFEAGIIEPAKVLISALKNASAVGAMILTTDCVMVNEGEE